MFLSKILSLLSIITFALIPSAPGYAVYRLLYRETESIHIFEIPALSFVFGLGLFSYIALFGYFFKGSLYAVFVVYFIITLGLYIVVIVCRKGLRPKIVWELNPWEISFVVGVFVLSVVMFFIGSHQLLSDSWRLLPFIRKIYAREMLSIDIFSLSQNVPINNLTVTYIYNAFFPLYSFVARLYRLDPALVWFHMPAVIVILLFSSYYVVAINIFDKRFIAPIAFLITIIFWATFYTRFNPDPGFGMIEARRLAYPHSIASIVYLVLISHIFKFISRSEIDLKRAVLFALCGAALLLFHIQWWAYFLATLLILLLHFLLLKSPKRSLRTLFLLGLALLCSVPVLVPFYKFYQIVSGELESVMFYKFGYKIYSVGKLYAFNPYMLFSIPLWIFTAAGFVFLLWRLGKGYDKKDSGAVFSALVISGSFFAVVAPPMATLISKLSTVSITGRFTWLIDFWGFFLAAYLFLGCWSGFSTWLHKRHQAANRNLRFRVESLKNPSDFLKYLLPVLIIVLFIVIPKSRINPKYENMRDSKTWYPSLTQVIYSPSSGRMFELIEDRSVVICGRMMRPFILTFKDVTICGDIYDQYLRSKEINEFIDPIFEENTPITDIFERLSTLSPDYLILSPFEDDISEKYDAYPQTFEKVFDGVIPEIKTGSGRFVIYKVHLSYKEDFGK